MASFEWLAAARFEEALAAEGPKFTLDVRERADYETGHVPGATPIHVHELARRRDELPARRVTRMLLVGGPDEKRTRAAANWLVLMGYSDVAALEGGFPAWTGAVETGPPPPPRPRGPELRVL